MSDKNWLGQIGLYRTDGRNGISYDLPAIVTCTRESHPGDYPDGRANPLPVPLRGRVHLTVFTPGGYGTTVTPISGVKALSAPKDEDFVGGTQLNPGSGTYVEWDVPVLTEITGLAVKIEITPEKRTWRPL